MIIVLKNGTTQEDINKIAGWLSRYNVEVCPIVGAETTVLGVVGDDLLRGQEFGLSQRICR